MKNLFLLGIIVVLFGNEILGHSYLTKPISRGNQAQSQGGCRGPACLGPCELPAAQARAPVATSRGATLSIGWPRNNHAGGFVRFAWAPTDKSDDQATFDNGADSYICFEVGSLCKPDDPALPNGGDSAGQYACGADIVVPGWLTDGKWTLQWAWFGGAFTLGDYYGCVDYVVSGGDSSNQQQPMFKPGDYSYPDQCKYFSTNALHVCINEPCTGPTAGVESKGSPIIPQIAGVSGGGSSDVPCTSNSDCSSGVCQVNGFCYKRKGLDAGGISALFFAFFFVALVAVAVIFAVINKSEWRNWKPFHVVASKPSNSTGKYGFGGNNGA